MNSYKKLFHLFLIINFYSCLCLTSNSLTTKNDSLESQVQDFAWYYNTSKLSEWENDDQKALHVFNYFEHLKKRLASFRHFDTFHYPFDIEEQDEKLFQELIKIRNSIVDQKEKIKKGHFEKIGVSSEFFEQNKQVWQKTKSGMPFCCFTPSEMVDIEFIDSIISSKVCERESRSVKIFPKRFENVDTPQKIVSRIDSLVADTIKEQRYRRYNSSEDLEESQYLYLKNKLANSLGFSSQKNFVENEPDFDPDTFEPLLNTPEEIYSSTDDFILKLIDNAPKKESRRAEYLYLKKRLAHFLNLKLPKQECLKDYDFYYSKLPKHLEDNDDDSDTTSQNLEDNYYDIDTTSHNSDISNDSINLADLHKTIR